MKYSKVNNADDIYKVDDWRIQGQPGYLYEKKLYFKKFIGDKTILNDHRHCEFCFDLFSDREDCCHLGYYDPISHSWICEGCFNDFKDMFNWTVVDELQSDKLSGT